MAIDPTKIKDFIDTAALLGVTVPSAAGGGGGSSGTVLINTWTSADMGAASANGSYAVATLPAGTFSSGSCFEFDCCVSAGNYSASTGTRTIRLKIGSAYVGAITRSMPAGHSSSMHFKGRFALPDASGSHFGVTECLDEYIADGTAASVFTLTRMTSFTNNIATTLNPDGYINTLGDLSAAMPVSLNYVNTGGTAGELAFTGMRLVKLN